MSSGSCSFLSSTRPLLPPPQASSAGARPAAGGQNQRVFVTAAARRRLGEANGGKAGVAEAKLPKYTDIALGLLPLDSVFRQICIHVIESYAFETFIMLTILVSARGGDSVAMTPPARLPGRPHASFFPGAPLPLLFSAWPFLPRASPPPPPP